MVIRSIHSILELTQKSAGMLILTNRFLIAMLKSEHGSTHLKEVIDNDSIANAKLRWLFKDNSSILGSGKFSTIKGDNTIMNE